MIHYTQFMFLQVDISALFKCPIDGKHEKIIFLNALKGNGLDLLYEAIDKYF